MRTHTTLRRSRESGQSVIETSLTIVIIFTVVFWMFEVGWLVYTYSVMADAANEGVRHAIVRSGGDAGGGTQTTVKNFASASLHDTSSILVDVTPPDGDYIPPHRVRVKVSYAYVPWLSVFMNDPPAMSTYSEGRMVVQ
jgi:Flp pilus assembly protein TadG